jgi:hypothetical protein
MFFTFRTSILVLILIMFIISTAPVVQTSLPALLENASAAGPQTVSLRLNSAQFETVSNTTIHQLKILVNYTTNDLKTVNNKINGVMKVYALNGSLLKTSSFPSGFIVHASGAAQFKTTIIYSYIKNVTAVAQLTDLSKTLPLSNAIRIKINLGQNLKF